MTSHPRVVIVEDDALIAIFLQGTCEQFGAEVVGAAADGENALRILREEKPSHVLMDMRLQGPMDGADIGMVVSREQPDLKIIYVTGSNEPATLERISQNNPYRILIKPVVPDQVNEALS